jgi:hypothetical protein
MTIRLNRWFAIVLCAGFIALLLVLAPSQSSVSSAAQTPCPPVPAEPRITGAAMQRYEHGYMIWLQDTKMFYVLYGDQFSGALAETYPDDQWKEGMPETDPNIVAPSGKFQPTRGGGYLWRTNQKVRDGLGWGIEPPTGFTTLIETRGDKIWLNGQGYDVFTISGKSWQEHDAWRN